MTTRNPMHRNLFQTLFIRSVIALAATVVAVSSAQAIAVVLPGATPGNPIMPIGVVNGAFQFRFTPLPGVTFIDPLVAVGYEYALSDLASPAFQSVELPSVGDNLFTLSLWNGSQWTAAGTLQSGSANAHDFGFGGVREFRITGIEVSAALDPTNPSAFVTGLRFAGTNLVNMTQAPITVSAVPEPATYALMIFGLAALGLWARRRAPLSSRSSGPGASRL